MKSETFSSNRGEIAINAKQIILTAKDGEVFTWPPDFKQSPRLDTLKPQDKARFLMVAKANDTQRAAVIREVLEHDAQHLAHPVILGWIEHNQIVISTLRAAGKKFDDQRIKQATKNLRAIGDALVAGAKGPVKSGDAISAARYEALCSAAKPFHRVWWEARKLGVAERCLRVVTAFVPSGYGSEYDRTFKNEIQRWIRTFEDCSECKRGEISLRQAVIRRLQEDGVTVDPSKISRGRRKLKGR